MLGEAHATRREPVVFGVDVVHEEGSERDTVVEQGIFERLDRGVGVRFEQKPGAGWLIGGDQGDPAVLAERKVLLLGEAEVSV